MSNRKPKTKETTLQRWLARTKFTQQDLERVTGIDQGLISKYARGKWAPGLRNALLIEKATGGGVPVDCWGGDDIQKEIAQTAALVLA